MDSAPSDTREQGFPGQKIVVLPRPRVREALVSQGISPLMVTDCGYYPQARTHGIKRDQPISQAVILLCGEGKGWCEVEGVRHSVSRGEAVIIPPGAMHAYFSDPENPWTIWWLHVDGREIAETIAMAGMTTASPVRVISEPQRSIGIVEEIIRRLSYEVSRQSCHAAAGAAWHLLTLLAYTAPDSTRRNAVDEVLAYFTDHLSEKISVRELAAMVSLSPSHLSARFREQVGYPLITYLINLRMTEARRLLETTDMPISQVANRVGFVDSFYFSRQFKQVHGITPFQHRAQNR